MKEEKQSGFSRRGFLRTLGVVTGAAAIAPLAPGTVAKSVAKSMTQNVFGGSPIKIGVIMQRGTWTSESALSGMLLHLHEVGNTINGRTVQLVVESIGNGEASLLTKTTKLVEKDNVDVVIAQVNSRAAQGVHSYVKEKLVTFVEMNAGEVITQPVAVAPNYFRSTLNLWQAHAAMGSWAATSIGSKASMMTSFTMSGFDFHPAFRLGFEAAGGTIVSSRVTGAPTGTDHPALVIGDLPNHGADLLYASYSDQGSHSFVQAYQSSGMNVPVLGTNFSEGSQGSMGNGAKLTGARYAGSWSAALPNTENKRFVETYEAFSGKPADEYAVLGNDTIRMILAACARSSNVAEGLAKVALVGPRGEMRFDASAQTLLTEVHLFESNGTPVKELEYAASIRATATAVSGPTGGWLNSYLAS